MFAFIILATSLTPLSYAGHGSPGGGGCSGDCYPPTLGLDDRGNVRVDKGLTINSQEFDVEFYGQTLPTQTFKTGEKTTILLKIYENTSPEFLSHIELHFNTYDKVLEGTTIEESSVSIVWDDTGGDEVYGVYGDESMIKNVDIHHEIQDNLAFVTFEFEWVGTMQKSTLMTKIWDEKRNSVQNYFYDASEVIDESITKSVSTLPDDFDSQEEEATQYESTEKPKIPSWIQSTAGWWSEGKIGDSDFILGIQYLIEMKVITVDSLLDDKTENANNKVPNWIKNTAGWWSEGMLSDDDFVKGIQYMVTNGIILV